MDAKIIFVPLWGSTVGCGYVDIGHVELAPSCSIEGYTRAI